MTKNYLAIYLNDHLAGSTALVELAKRGAREYEGTELGAFLAQLGAEVAADRRELRALMASLGARPQVGKVALAWLGEKVGRLKPNGHLRGGSPLSPLVELEAVAIGVHGKLLLWKALLADDAPVVGDRARLDELSARAERQHAAVERHRVETVRRAFSA